MTPTEAMIQSMIFTSTWGEKPSYTSSWLKTRDDGTALEIIHVEASTDIFTWLDFSENLIEPLKSLLPTWIPEGSLKIFYSSIAPENSTITSHAQQSEDGIP